MDWKTEKVKRSDKAKVKHTGFDQLKDNKNSVGDKLGDQKDTVGDKSKDQKMDFAGRLPMSSTPVSVKTNKRYLYLLTETKLISYLLNVIKILLYVLGMNKQLIFQSQIVILVILA